MNLDDLDCKKWNIWVHGELALYQNLCYSEVSHNGAPLYIGGCQTQSRRCEASRAFQHPGLPKGFDRLHRSLAAVFITIIIWFIVLNFKIYNIEAHTHYTNLKSVRTVQVWSRRTFLHTFKLWFNVVLLKPYSHVIKTFLMV